MDKHFISQNEALNTIERRFQFVILLTVFLPFIKDSLSKATGGIVADSLFFIGMIVSCIFLSYFLFEFFRKSMTNRILRWLGSLLIGLSYTLIVIISFSALQPSINLNGWKFILLAVSILLCLILSYLIVILSFSSFLKNFFYWLINLKKENIRSVKKFEKKCWPEYFQKIMEGKKTFELRLNDFEVEEGDVLILKEWSPETKDYTGREIKKRVGYVGKWKVDDLTQFWSKSDIEGKGIQVISLKD